MQRVAQRETIPLKIVKECRKSNSRLLSPNFFVILYTYFTFDNIYIRTFRVVDARAMRSTQLKTRTSTVYIQAKEAEEMEKTESRVSPGNKTSYRSLTLRMRDLTYILASGPSKRGAGH